MDRLFKNPKELEGKVELEECTAEDEPRRWKKANENFPDAACRILQFLAGFNADDRAASLAEVIAPKASAAEKWWLEMNLAKDIAMLRENAAFLKTLQLPEQSEFLIAAEIEVAKGELRGIDAPPGGVKIVVMCRYSTAKLNCYKGGDAPGSGFSAFSSDNFLTNNFTSMFKYRGVLILCAAEKCAMVTYDQTEGFFSVRKLAPGFFLQDNTTNPPTLLGWNGSSNSDGWVKRYGEVLENTEILLECLITSCREYYNRAMELIDGELVGYAIDERGNIWLRSDNIYYGEMHILSPDLIHICRIYFLQPVYFYTSPAGGACICPGKKHWRLPREIYPPRTSGFAG